MHQHSVRSAFCLLFFNSNGGQFDELNRPIFKGELGTCDRAYDCGTCPLMGNWVYKLAQDGWAVGWECDKCLKDTLDGDRARPYGERILPGYYQSSMPDDEDRPPIGGCTRCGWQTSFLQLILRR